MKYKELIKNLGNVKTTYSIAKLESDIEDIERCHSMTKWKIFQELKIKH